MKLLKENGAVIGKPILRPVLRTEARKLMDFLMNKKAKIEELMEISRTLCEMEVFYSMCCW